MSKRCPDCGAVNDDSRLYCGHCGEPLDANLRLLKQLNDETAKPRTPANEAPAQPKPAPKPKSTPAYDDEPVGKLAKEKKSALPWILLGAAVVIAAAVLILLYVV